MRAERMRRCAIYTRKSTEEGLEQAFNSLDAQREACAAYILSQRHEGWELVPDLYDDGGCSGGTMDRPGLKHLLADMQSGKIDVIVVYKVDRLTRSLADFAKIVEVLDKQEASFVSVTQAFNTTSSMGRLTLNVLLSFAQFEREVTGERIRDKVAASKARGMWMGGLVPLGYEVRDRKLVLAPEDAAPVRLIFERYLELGSVLALAEDLAAAGVRSKARISRAGKSYGNVARSPGALYLMLRNQIYIGKICHKGTAYPGEHEAIIEPELFERVAALLDRNRNNHVDGVHADEPSLLVGKVWDSRGRRMSPDHACKRNKRYRYYVSRTEEPASKPKPWRVPAGDLEALVINQLQRRLDEVDGAGLLLTSEGRIDSVEQRRLIATYVQRVEVHPEQIIISFRNDEPVEPVVVPASIVRRGKETRLAVAPESSGVTSRDPALIKLLVKAQIAREAVEGSNGTSVSELAAEYGYTRDYFGVLLRIAYLAPDIVAAIVDGRQPVQLNRQRLARATNLPIAWQAQREMLGFA